MLKLCRLIKENQEGSMEEAETREESSKQDEEGFAHIINLNRESQEDSDDKSINLFIQEDECESNAEKVIDEEREKHTKDFETEEETTALLVDCEICSNGLTVKGVRCAAHTLQLAVDDSIKNHRMLINKARKAAVQFRVESVLRKARAIGRGLGTTKQLPKPPLDVDTRWHSTIDMLLVLALFRSYGYLIKNCNLSDEEWDELELYIQSLMPAKIATKLLQEKALLMSDFTNRFENMEKREKSLIGNEILLASMYLNPRFAILLEGEGEETAARHFQILHNRLARERGICEEKSVYSTSNEVDDEDDSAAAEIARRVARKFREKNDLSNGRVQADDLRLQLKNFQEQIPQPESCDLLAYWKDKKHTWPELHELAMIVLATPATQVSVERLFSGMRYIFSTLRGNLKGDILDAILLIRCNSDIFDKNDSDDDDDEHIESKKMLYSVT
ncbi:zinc finger BED domain-containing protein 4-like [Belonocnema kinseyi]|uniref:zinc finger BED domain-containing protein 4-like n=1 Tax=Belonocnema kinseyi TaxID=2817044 RepID=UPI00143DACEB|nr:zinc finger BED domain-containing protein 4-like [Belonocnema kinseyi]